MREILWTFYVRLRSRQKINTTPTNEETFSGLCSPKFNMANHLLFIININNIIIIYYLLTSFINMANHLTIQQVLEKNIFYCLVNFRWILVIVSANFLYLNRLLLKGNPSFKNTLSLERMVKDGKTLPRIVTGSQMRSEHRYT